MATISLAAITPRTDSEKRVARGVMWRYPAMLMGAFAAIALLMAVIGTYGLVAYGVSQRLHEIGVRVALGARPADILRLVMGRSLALSGIAVGLGRAAVPTRGLQKLLFGVKAMDSATFGVVAAVLVGAVLAASFIPARRASQVGGRVGKQQAALSAAGPAESESAGKIACPHRAAESCKPRGEWQAEACATKGSKKSKLL